MSVRRLCVLGIASILLAQLACSAFTAPVRRLPAEKSGVKIEIIQKPEILHRKEVGIFALKTAPNNLCMGAIGYTDIVKNKWVYVDLPELVADSQGICQWNWEAPLTAEVGIAEFRADAEEEEGIHGNIAPQTFCIEKCPWGEATIQP